MTQQTAKTLTEFGRDLFPQFGTEQAAGLTLAPTKRSDRPPETVSTGMDMLLDIASNVIVLPEDDVLPDH